MIEAFKNVDSELQKGEGLRLNTLPKSILY